MARPKKGYGKTPDGRKVVGVTTPLSYVGNKNGMIYAAAKLGMDGIWYQDEWYKAANAGTLAHDMIEAHITGQDSPDLSEYPQDVIDKAETAFLGWLKWADQVQFQLIETEISLYDMELGLAGTPDLAAIMGRDCILDWKTSKDIYLENWCQLAAYRHLWEVNHPDRPVEDAYILQLNKEDGGFSYHHKPSLDPYWKLYQTILTFYRQYKELGGK